MKRILTIAGSDSGGGAGIQADLKTITVLGGYGMSVITALTAQNTLGVQGMQPVSADFIRLQMRSVFSDMGADGVKTGMLGNSGAVMAVADEVRRYGIKFLVVDPVMAATSGDPLLSASATATLRESLFPLAHVVTPNLHEAGVLCGFPVEDLGSMKDAARKIHQMGPRFVLVKGGHLKGDAVDLLFDGNNFKAFHASRLNNPNTHGTGCALSAALATFLAQGMAISAAVKAAKNFISQAVEGGLDLGAGRGPVNPCARWLSVKTGPGSI